MKTPASAGVFVYPRLPLRQLRGSVISVTDRASVAAYSQAVTHSSESTIHFLSDDLELAVLMREIGETLGVPITTGAEGGTEGAATPAAVIVDGRLLLRARSKVRAHLESARRVMIFGPGDTEPVEPRDVRQIPMPFTLADVSEALAWLSSLGEPRDQAPIDA